MSQDKGKNTRKINYLGLKTYLRFLILPTPLRLI